MMRRNWLTTNVSHGALTGSWISWRKPLLSKRNDRPKATKSFTTQLRICANRTAVQLGDFSLCYWRLLHVDRLLHLAFRRKALAVGLVADLLSTAAGNVLYIVQRFLHRPFDSIEFFGNLHVRVGCAVLVLGFHWSSPVTRCHHVVPFAR